MYLLDSFSKVEKPFFLSLRIFSIKNESIHHVLLGTDQVGIYSITSFFTFFLNTRNWTSPLLMMKIKHDHVIKGLDYSVILISCYSRKLNLLSHVIPVILLNFLFVSKFCWKLSIGLFVITAEDSWNVMLCN